jgi:ATP-binding cassette subfamily F protein uup
VKPTRRAKKKKPLTWAQERELATILDEVDRAESTVVALTAELADPTTYLDGGKKVASLTAALESAKQEVTRLTQRWEQLETKKESEV